MKIYNENMELLSNYNMREGWLEQKTKTTIIPAVAEVKEKGHYREIRSYANGGKDLEWVIDVEGVKGMPEREEVEEYYIFHPYTEEEREQHNKPTSEERLKMLEEALEALLEGATE